MSDCHWCKKYMLCKQGSVATMDSALVCTERDIWPEYDTGTCLHPDAGEGERCQYLRHLKCNHFDADTDYAEVGGCIYSPDAWELIPPTELYNIIDARNAMAMTIHYPECWDTMAYPTLDDAVWEMFSPLVGITQMGGAITIDGWRCPTCGERQRDPYWACDWSNWQRGGGYK